MTEALDEEDEKKNDEPTDEKGVEYSEEMLAYLAVLKRLDKSKQE